MGLRECILVAMKILPPSEMQVLALVLTPHTGQEVGLLFRDLTGVGLSHGSLYSALRRLRERGLVLMRKHEDPRCRLFVASAAGKRKLAQTQKLYAELAAFGA